jgi:hypothetical protein
MGDVINELNEPLFEIVNVLPDTSSSPNFPSLNKLEISKILLANPFTFKLSAFLMVPTNNPS